MPIDDTIMTIRAADDRLILHIKQDGGVEFGPAYTTDDAAAKLFYEVLALQGRAVNGQAIEICESHLLEYATSRYQVGYNQAVKDIHKALEETKT